MCRYSAHTSYFTTTTRTQYPYCCICKYRKTSTRGISVTSWASPRVAQSESYKKRRAGGNKINILFIFHLTQNILNIFLIFNCHKNTCPYGMEITKCTGYFFNLHSLIALHNILSHCSNSMYICTLERDNTSLLSWMKKNASVCRKQAQTTVIALAIETYSSVHSSFGKLYRTHNSRSA